MPAIYTKANWAWAKTVSAARGKAGLTQEGLGKAIGLNQQDVSKLETGRRPLRAPEIPIVAKACRMTPKQLFNVFLALYGA